MEENEKREEFSDFIIDDTNYPTKLNTKYLRRKPYRANEKNLLRALIPGTIRDVFVQEGDLVDMGDNLLVLEAMKMRNMIKSSLSGKIKSVKVKTDQNVAKDEILIEFDLD